MDSLAAWLAGAAFLAGFIDAVAGGGGLVQLPALLIAWPQQPPATVFGTNKFAAVWGTLTAAARYSRRVHFDMRLLAPAAFMALLGAWSGARCVALLSPALLRPLALLLLVAVALHTFARPALGEHHAPRLSPPRARLVLAAIAGLIGFYDGFFGPGTGAFLVFLLVRVLGFDFLHASAYAKLLNVATNLAALAFFVPNGAILWPLAAIMAACNVAGAAWGSHLALRHGNRFVRTVFLAVVLTLLARLGADLLFAA